jgi:uncharacterized repeat protein (TIGR01451 family)
VFASSRLRAVAAVAATAVVAVACQEFLVDVSDETPPTITGIAFSLDTIDISAGQQSVRVDVGGRDDSGIDSLVVLIQSPSDFNRAECLSDTPSTGTTQQGEWGCNLVLESGWETGAWSVSTVTLFDAAGNTSILTTADLVDAGYPTRVEVVAPTAEADLSLTVAASSDTVFVGRAMQYVLTVRNNGPSTTTGVTVIDTLPTAVAAGSMTPSQGSCGLNGALVTCALGVIANGGTATVVLGVTPTAEGILTNAANVTSDLPDPNPGDNTAATTTRVETIPPGDLVLTLVVQPDPVQAGDDLRHDIDVSNPGPGTITDVTVLLTIEGSVVTVTTPPRCTVSTQSGPPRTSLSCGIASLGVGQTATLSPVVSAVRPGEVLISTATIESWTGPGDPTSVNNSATDTTIVNRRVLWTNAAGGMWSDRGNWSSGSVPTVADSVEIVLTGTYSVTLDTDAVVGHVSLGGPSGTQRLVVSAPALTVDSVLVVRAGGLLELSGGVLTGPGTVSIGSAMEWTAGTMSGAGTTRVEVGARLDMTGSTPKGLDTRTVDVAGTALWTAGTVSAGNASFNVLGTGVFDVQSADLFEWTPGEPRSDVSIAGSLVRSGSTGTVSFTTGVNNSGTIDVQSGTLLLGGNGVGMSDGSVIVALGARLDFSGTATHTLAAGSSVAGQGDLYVTGGSVSVAGSYDVSGSTDVSAGSIAFESLGGAVTARATISGGAVTGAGSLTIGSVVFWTGGSVALQGQLRVPAGALAALRTPATKALGGGGLQVGGNVQWIEGDLSVDGGTIDVLPTGFWNMSGDIAIRDVSPVSVTPELRNSGTLTRRISGSSLPTDSAQIEISVANSGVIWVQAAGSLTLSADFTHADQAVLQGRGTIDLQGANVLAFDGDVNPGVNEAGAMTLLGAFSPTPSSTVNIELGGTAVDAEYDQLDISGLATLDGTLAVSLINGFMPADADTFTVLRHGSRSGTFASTTGLDLGAGVTLLPAYTDTAVYLIAQVQALSLAGTIVFVSERDGTRDIYSKDLGTGVVTQLTNSLLAAETPVWSPDGTRIAVIRRLDLWVMDADGTNLVQFTTGGTSAYPSWSPDGLEIVYMDSSDGDWDLWALEVANPTNTRIVTNTSNQDRYPSFSPDGSQLVFSRGNSLILTINVDGSNETTVYVNSTRYPAWSPDGAFIAFTQVMGSGWQIMTLRLSDLTVQQVTNEPAMHWNPTWSPDGAILMFDKTPDLATVVFDLWAKRADGNGSQVLVEASPAHDFWASWKR